MQHEAIYTCPRDVHTRWASPENWGGEKGAAAQENGGRKGSANFTLPAGEARVLAEVAGTSGMIRRIWVTIGDRSPLRLRGLRLDFYWDGADTPAISAPLGDFFGQGLGRPIQFESALFSNPEGRSFNCCVPMPFRTDMKVVLTNEIGPDLGGIYFDVDYTIGDRHADDVLYLHACWRRENPTRMQDDYAFLPKVSGRGRFLGVHVGVIPDAEAYDRTWWGEGECKFYLDGDTEYPTLSGTGTEDYIGTAWGQGQYANLYQGCHLAGGEKFQYCFYRLHLPDPIYFHTDIRVTMQQIGCWGPDQVAAFEKQGRQLIKAGPGLANVDMKAAADAGGYGLFERRDDWSSCAYFYLDRPINDLPPLAAAETRIAGLMPSEDASARLDA